VLIAARTAVMTAVAAIDADMRRMARASAACRPPRAFAAHEISAPTWASSQDGISRARLHRRHLEMRRPAGPDPAVRGRQRHADLYKGQLKLKDWAFAIARRSTMRKARIALARRLAIIMHAMLRYGTEFASA
jgi:transposase